MRTDALLLGIYRLFRTWMMRVCPDEEPPPDFEDLTMDYLGDFLVLEQTKAEPIEHVGQRDK